MIAPGIGIHLNPNTPQRGIGGGRGAWRDTGSGERGARARDIGEKSSTVYERATRERRGERESQVKRTRESERMSASARCEGRRRTEGDGAS
jgi:hypothetical protein